MGSAAAALGSAAAALGSAAAAAATRSLFGGGAAPLSPAAAAAWGFFGAGAALPYCARAAGPQRVREEKRTRTLTVSSLNIASSSFESPSCNHFPISDRHFGGRVHSFVFSYSTLKAARSAELTSLHNVPDISIRSRGPIS